MDAEKKVKKGIAEKRGVRKATKRNPDLTKAVDLSAAGDGSDLIQSEMAESPTTPRKKGNRRGNGLAAAQAPGGESAGGLLTSDKGAETQSGASAVSATVASPISEEPTAEQIQLRAYFISERRKSAGLPGDENGDWDQALQELRNEPSGR